MGSNFNLNANTEKEEDEVDEEIEEELHEEKEIRKEQDSTKKQLIKLMIIVMALFFGLLIILWLVSVIMPKSYTYEQVEEIMKKAAIEYFAEYPENLPKGEGQGIEIDCANLVAAGKMKDLSNYVGEGNACTGTVQVQKSGDDYLYTPYLNCGEEYATMELYKAVVSQGTVNQGQYGLYRIGSDYVFRGEKVNNYVELDEGLWRIVKINAKGNVVLVKDEAVGSPVPYDDRYNEEKEWKSGINAFGASRLKDSIENMYQNPDKDLKEVFLSKEDKQRIVTFNLCVGKRAESDTGNDNSIECKTTQANTKVGLLTVSDYMRASIDSNCTTTISKSCTNYNYLKTDFSWWSVTANSASTSEAYLIDDGGSIESNMTTIYAYIRPVIYLNERTMYKSGEGTKSKPYKLK